MTADERRLLDALRKLDEARTDSRSPWAVRVANIAALEQVAKQRAREFGSIS